MTPLTPSAELQAETGDSVANGTHGIAQNLVVIVGATGTGKSELSLDLAQSLNRRGLHAEIINADAMQLYRGMDIGTAKLPASERRGIRHHLLDVLDPTDDASVARYQADARQIILRIRREGHVPILVGGSGLYISSVIHDFQFPPRDSQVRARLETELGTLGVGALFHRLRELDPEAAQSIGHSNGRRIVRALEVMEITGKPFGAGLPEEQTLWIPSHIVGIAAPREQLVARLNDRVRGMWRSGLLDEVRSLRPRGFGATATRAIGYAQAIKQLNGELSEADAVDGTAALTRRYARRQVGWFKRYRQCQWLSYDDPDRVRNTLAMVMGENGAYGNA
ncbi:tRNA dimethylallyltransferase [Rhodoglobus vestalii]|uniref:tRNA dimethylallyltransferase n=1 Tax=Rhodoglobus vestalii TaxID=193384 RepID=A0A8H2K4V1_9MICO|nr:tRNA (adenosine(37)-N6)-dimethylallyltransferase MiaA [Rhodoglobus vestalii]TQO18927.1 tRNA dimethylallyltransferase [Rhodoglobus vestalii]